MAFVLAFARGLHRYIPQQMQREWRQEDSFIHLPDTTALIIGVRLLSFVCIRNVSVIAILS